MLQRRQEIRAQTAFFFADSIQVPALQQQSKKALSKIFCLFRPDALSPYETINWSPVSAAKFFERFLGRGRSASCREHNAPMSCCKRHRAALCSRRDLIPRGLTVLNRHA